MRIEAGGYIQTARGKYQIASIEGFVVDTLGQRHHIGDVDFMYGPGVKLIESNELDGVQKMPYLDKLEEMITAYVDSGCGTDVFNEWEGNFINDLWNKRLKFGSKITITPAIAAKIEEVYEEWKKK